MEKLVISAGAGLLLAMACGPMTEPKQAWERPPGAATESSAEPAPASSEPSAPKEPSHEDVCRKMWSLIATDAETRAKKNPKVKVPNDENRSEFLQECFKRGADDKKNNPEKYSCQRKCILESEVLDDVEKCAKGCK